MQILCPIDGSDTSFRALRFAAEMLEHYDGELHVVHFSGDEGPAVQQILDRARTVLDEVGVDAEPRVATDLELDFRPSDRVGEDILNLVEELGIDHVVMGHHGSGMVERAILGSATETVIRADTVPVTVIP
ncbi:MAG: universal stress protein [Halobacteriaceae archaeon]